MRNAQRLDSRLSHPRLSLQPGYAGTKRPTQAHALPPMLDYLAKGRKT